jgi:hypothetical protein
MALEQLIRFIDVLKWPVVVLICFVILVILFRTQVADLISRITAVGRQGVKALPSGDQNSVPASQGKFPGETIVALQVSVRDRSDIVISEGET